MRFHLGRRRQNRLFQLLVLFEAFGKSEIPKVPLAFLIKRPKRSAGYPSNVSAGHDFHGYGFALLPYHHIGIGKFQRVVWHDVRGVLEPEPAHAREHLALERNEREIAVKRRVAVGGNQNQLIVLLIDIPNLAGILLAEIWEIRAFQHPIEMLFDEFLVHNYSPGGGNVIFPGSTIVCRLPSSTVPTSISSYPLALPILRIFSTSTAGAKI